MYHVSWGSSDARGPLAALSHLKFADENEGSRLCDGGRPPLPYGGCAPPTPKGAFIFPAQQVGVFRRRPEGCALLRGLGRRRRRRG